MSDRRRRVVFYRNFRGFSGGHLKVWDYFNHVRHSERHEALICFSEESVWDDSNPWRDVGQAHRGLAWRASEPDLLFLAGLDWLILDPFERDHPPVPVINLIQGLRHASPGDPRHAFLGCKAIRICVSEEVRDAVTATGRVNGPCFVIPNGIDVRALPPPREPGTSSIDVLIVAVKQPELGLELARRLGAAGRRVETVTAMLPRAEFVGRMNAARVTAFLPRPEEGFYLPALEGMAVGTLVVCPDCTGNRDFCVPGENCFRPRYALDDIEQAVETAIRLTPGEASVMLATARATVQRHDLMRERQAFLGLLHELQL